MQNKKLRNIIGVILVIFGALLLFLTPADLYLIRICGVLLIAAGLFMILKKCTDPEKKGTDHSTEDTLNNLIDPRKQMHNVVEIYIDKLCKLNLNMRLDREISLTVLKRTEDIIDQLLKIVPKAKEEMPSSETTFELARLSEIHLPELIKEYLDLNNESRASVEEDIIRQLTELDLYIADVAGNLERGQKDQFDLASQFLKSKFSK